MATRPKGKLFALLAIFVAIGLVTASGAFTTIQADRTVTVDTAGDASALLQLEGNTSSGNDRYISTEGTPGEIVIDFSSGNLGSATGVNVNATTNVSHMINVTNNGPNAVTFWVTIGSTPSGVTLDFYQGADTSNSITGSSTSGITIGSGAKESIGISLDLASGVSDFNATVTFHAESQ